MIDDHLKNLRTFGGKKVLFTQPHNMSVKDKMYQRVTGWKDIMEIL